MIYCSVHNELRVGAWESGLHYHDCEKIIAEFSCGVELCLPIACLNYYRQNVSPLWAGSLVRRLYIFPLVRESGTETIHSPFGKGVWYRDYTFPLWEESLVQRLYIPPLGRESGTETIHSPFGQGVW